MQKTLTLAALVLFSLAACAHRNRLARLEEQEPADPPADYRPEAVEMPTIDLTETALSHFVARGEYLQVIARKHAVSWEQVLLKNEEMLKEKYEQVCAGLPATSLKKRAALSCDDRRRKPYADNIHPGWKLMIPMTEAPNAVDVSVSSVGRKIALVIDETGGSKDDIGGVSQQYLAAIRGQNKRLVGLFLVGDGGVRRYKAGVVYFLKTGGRDRAKSVLQKAAATLPDAIILVTRDPCFVGQASTEGNASIIIHGSAGYDDEVCSSGRSSRFDDPFGPYVEPR